jgi:hypothetical protein
MLARNIKRSINYSSKLIVHFKIIKNFIISTMESDLVLVAEQMKAQREKEQHEINSLVSELNIFEKNMPDVEKKNVKVTT